MFSYKRHHLTKSWVTLVFCLCLLVGFLITWLLVGELNLIYQQWLIPHKGALWHGYLDDHNRQWVWNTFQKWIGKNENDFFNTFTTPNGNYEIVNKGALVFNPLILIPILSLFSLSLIVPMTLRLFKVMEIDVVPFAFTISLTSVILIMSGLIPQDIGGAWIWVIKIVICLISLFLIFYITNKIINNIIANSGLSAIVISELSELERKRNMDKKTIYDLKNSLSKQDEMSFVDTKKID